MISEATVMSKPAVRVWRYREPMGVVLLDCRADGLAGIIVFGDPDLVARPFEPA